MTGLSTSGALSGSADISAMHNCTKEYVHTILHCSEGKAMPVQA
jgi:hypothetical protein